MAYLHYRTLTLISIQVQITVPKMGTLEIGDLSSGRGPNCSLCNRDSFHTLQCSHGIWNPISSRFLAVADPGAKRAMAAPPPRACKNRA